MFGSGCKVGYPFALLSALMTLGCNALMAWKSMHILLLSASPGADFLGTTTIRRADGEMLLVIIPAHSKLFISCYTQS